MLQLGELHAPDLPPIILSLFPTFYYIYFFIASKKERPPGRISSPAGSSAGFCFQLDLTVSVAALEMALPLTFSTTQRYW